MMLSHARVQLYLRLTTLALHMAGKTRDRPKRTKHNSLRAPLGVRVLYMHNKNRGLNFKLKAIGPDCKRLGSFVPTVSSEPEAPSAGDGRSNRAKP
jgi:hypothetical protein